jgi:drug/metabolite transporter (DMT)-like permease
VELREGVLVADTLPVAAVTESGIYLWFKTQANDETNHPSTKMTQMFGGSLVFWVIGIAIALAVGGLGLGALSISGRGLSTVLLFNALVGFTGYALRFYLIPKVSTVVFSALSFFGIIAAYAMGWGFSGEIPTATQGLGALAIVVANAVLLTKETV